MNSIHFQKNPVLGQIYWAQVCSKEESAHVFHPERHSKPIFDRSIPTMSTSRTHFSGGQELPFVIDRKLLPGLPRDFEKNMTSSPRTSTMPQKSPRFVHAGMQATRRLQTPSKRDPAGA
mmetsp:Transcript_54516/g.97380  ORF Transcript_54516/g.97380 Transcript_54516/m.97380 type:complete len:119 (-) Transcript_54516:137-493(-)